MDLLTSAWLKWTWAIGHAQALNREMASAIEAFDPDAVTFTAEYDAKRHGFPLVITGMPEFPPRVGLLLGDTVHNFRSALDHVAWFMVERGESPPATLSKKKQRRVAFPIAFDETWFDDSLQRMLPGVSSADIALVRRVQPYHASARKRRTRSLAVLGALDNLDKHRTVQPVLTWPTGGRIEVTEERDCIVRESGQIRGKGNALEVGTEIGLIRARKTGPHPHIEVDPDLSGQPSVYERILLGKWIPTIRDGIRDVLLTLGDAPAEIESLGVFTVDL